MERINKEYEPGGRTQVVAFVLLVILCAVMVLTSCGSTVTVSDMSRDTVYVSTVRVDTVMQVRENNHVRLLKDSVYEREYMRNETVFVERGRLKVDVLETAKIDTVYRVREKADTVYRNRIQEVAKVEKVRDRKVEFQRALALFICVCVILFGVYIKIARFV